MLVLSKGPLRSSASYLAQGGVAAALGEDDSPELHAEDTIRAGRGLCRESAVRALVEDAPARAMDLVALGVPFDPEPGLEGGHSRRRVLHVAGAATGKEILRVLVERVLEHPRIRVSEGELVHGVAVGEGRCAGVVTERRAIDARATLLATGGARVALGSGRRTRPARRATGWRWPSAPERRLADLEFVQFHPTVLAGNGLLLSEALRGEGAVLLDAEGRRFTDELAPRDVVARAVAERGTALLDLRRIDRGRFPGLMDALAEEGFDPRGADSRLARGALHDGRHRHRSRRPYGRPGPVRRRRVRLHRRPRREPARFELAARVPRLRPPRRARRPLRPRPERPSSQGQSLDRTDSRRGDAGAPRGDVARGRARSATPPGLRAPRRVAASPRPADREERARARGEPRRPLPDRLPVRGRGVRRRTASSAPDETVGFERWR